MAKKQPIYKGLAELSVQIDDRSLNSTDYFRITKMPTEFTAGVNTIKFKGNPTVFLNESIVEIEILDSNGEVVYHEIGLDLESEQQSAVINVFINQDTAPGIGTIYICGTINKDANGNAVEPKPLNLRWSAPINIDISKRNSVEILYERLPVVEISTTSGAYTNLKYPSNNRIVSNSITIPSGKLSYLNYNNQPLLSTGSRATFAFTSSAISSNVIITSNNLSNVSPTLPSNLGVLTYSSSIKNYSGSGIAYLSDPMVFKNPNGIENYIVKSANVLNFTYVVEQSASLGSATTENSYNEAVVYFNNLSPQSGQVAKIRSYYKSAGVGEYIFSNETDITSFASEAGFTPNTFTASFAIPTTHRNDRLDFKFEFVNPAGLVSKQVVETKNHLFLGGNTYVGGDDNLLTGSLFVAGSTGTGVHISGKGAAAMIRSIGYNGFLRATTTGPGGFVMYSGSIQPLLNASESYSGVGLELVANSESYFKYTTAGNGLLDIRTANFFLGNGSNSISGSNGNITISGSNVTVATPTFFLGDSLSYISGSNGNIKIATSKAFSGSKYISFSDYYIYNSGSITLSGSNVNIITPTIQIGTDANYIRAANGQITIASGYGQIGESYQNISDPMDPPVYDLLPVYGNGNILISGSNVDIKTPKFFLGDTTTSISGSNGNIKISGSNVDILTSKFFLGNPNSFISGSGNNIRISGSNVTVSTPSFLFGNQTTFISGSNGNILISGSNVSVNTSTFFLGNPNSFISGSGNNIRISGSNVTVSTPSFFLGDSNTSISGSNGNIRISGSNIDLFTDSFFLGNPNSFISGSGNNIRISGSNVTVSTPSFLLGNQTTFISGSNGNIRISGSNVTVSTPSFFLGDSLSYISGSNGNILISGSNVEIKTPAFLLGTSASYISGSDGKVEVYSERFIVTQTGIVTASGIFVPKGLNNVIYPMLNTDSNYIDSPNLGRCVHPTDDTEYTYVTASLFAAATPSPVASNALQFTSSVFKTVKFQHYINETRIGIAYQLRWALSSSTTNNASVYGGAIKAKIYFQQTGSGTGTPAPLDTSGLVYNVWQDSGYEITVWDRGTQVRSIESDNWVYTAIGKHMARYSVPSSLYGLKLRLDFYFTGSLVAVGGTGAIYPKNVTSSFFIRDIEVVTGGALALNMKQYDIANIQYSSLSAPPVFLPSDGIGGAPTP